MEIFYRAYFEQKFGVLTRRQYPHHHLYSDNFFECYLAIDYSTLDVLTPIGNAVRTHSIFRFRALLGYIDNNDNESVWAFKAGKCNQIGYNGNPFDCTQWYLFFQNGTHQRQLLIGLDTSVRKCMGIHALNLDGNYPIDVEQNTIVHNEGQSYQADGCRSCIPSSQGVLTRGLR